MVTHLADDRYDMIFDVTEAISWIGIKGDTVTLQELNEIDEDNFPHFRVDNYYKVLGVAVSEADWGVFGSRGKPFPNFEEIEKIFKLAEGWDYANVTNDERTPFIKNRWILDVTETPPGDINAVMTIRLQLTRNDNKAHLLAKFEKRVVPELISNSQVTSLYRGSSPGLGIDYVLRLSIDLTNGFKNLYELIERVHDLSLEERLKVDTTTYIVVKRLAKLSLSKAVLVTKLSRDKRYRDARISPYLNYDERVRLTYQSEKEQFEFIDLFRPVDTGLEEIGHLGLAEDEKKILRRKLTRGFFNKDFDLLREVHDPLQMRVERTLTNFIEEKIGEDDFKALKVKESIQSQRTARQMLYLDKIKVVIRYLEDAETNDVHLTALLRDSVADEMLNQLKVKEGIASNKNKSALSYQDKRRLFVRYLDESGLLSTAKSLISTNKVRNAFLHTDTERVNIKEVADAMINYSGFIQVWNSKNIRLAFQKSH